MSNHKKILGETTQMDNDYCPKCGNLFDAASGVGHDRKPKPGDLTICIACRSVLQFNRHLLAEEFTDWDQLDEDTLNTIKHTQQSMKVLADRRKEDRGTKVSQFVQDIVDDVFGPNRIEIDSYWLIDNKPCKIVSGRYWGEYGLSNFWGWKEVHADGSLTGHHSGYGGHGNWKKITKEEAIEIAKQMKADENGKPN